jgi:hypothetical protein
VRARTLPWFPVVGYTLPPAEGDNLDSDVKRLKNSLYNLALALVSLAVGLVLVELTWRSLRSNHYGPVTNLSYVAYDDTLGWKYRPGMKVRHKTDHFDVGVDIDAFGRRVGRECLPANSDGPVRRPPRLVFLGDSFTFGWGVEAKSSFACVLARQAGVRVTNLGVAGYGTDQEYLVFEASVAALAPDVVVLTFWMNDPWEVLVGRHYGRPKPSFSYQGNELKLSLADRRADFLDRHSSLKISLHNFFERRRRQPLTDLEEERAIRIIQELMRRMATRTVAMGSRFLLVSQDIEWLSRDFLPAGEGIYHLDVGPGLRKAHADGTRVRIPGDGHWSVAAHRIVASHIAEKLRKEILHDE